MKLAPCPNFNHGRSNAPVRICPRCGEVVNAAKPSIKCSEGEHGARRKNGDLFCVDCGLQLRVP